MKPRNCRRARWITVGGAPGVKGSSLPGCPPGRPEGAILPLSHEKIRQIQPNTANVPRIDNRTGLNIDQFVLI